ncbi:MAG: TonB-dependent receptor domain-containing protein [Gemmatimonadota bacterium]
MGLRLPLPRPGRAASALCALALLATLPADALAQNGGIAGIVRDDATAAPLAAVLVEAVDSNGAVVASGISGPGGAFRLNEVPAATYIVRFSAPGWATVDVAGQTVTAGQVTSVAATMSQQSYELNPLTVTASRGTEEKILDAPASIEVISQQDIRERPATTIDEHVKGRTGVDVINTGLQSSYVTVRGFNNIFSGATLTMTDNRIARVPSLRANISHFNPTTNLDLDRIEVVLGPASALYGPNAANGVIHSITRSPIDSPGASLSFAGGLRQQQSSPGIESNDEGLFHGEGRIAFAPSEKFGVKVSGQYFSGTEYQFIDPTEAEQRGIAAACIASDYSLSEPACLNFAQGLDLTNPTDQTVLRTSVDNVARGRNNDLRRWSLDVRADFRPNEDTDIIISAGQNQSKSSVDLTGIGAGQVIDWSSQYVQGRMQYKDFFAQAFFNRSDNDQTYLLRSGRPLIDKSQLFVAQLQNRSRIGDKQRLIYGADILVTTPKSQGSINGQFEDDDQVTEVGAYGQWEYALSPKFDLVAAARLDKHSRLENPVFSPRAAIVFKPDLANTFRATFNRAFSTPTTLNMFLDISSGTLPLGGPFQYDVRATGSSEVGHRFLRDDSGRAMHMSPFAPLLGGGKRDFLPTTTPQLWAEAVAAVSASNPLAGIPLGLIGAPTEAQVGILAMTLDPSLSQGDAPTAECPAPPFCFTPGGVDGIQDISRLKPTITNTVEGGYKGLIGERVLLGVNAWWSHITDFVSALQVSTPNVFLNGQQTGAYLTEQYLGLVGSVFPSEEAARATAAATAAAIGQIPLGVVTPESVGGTEPSLALVYRNLGSLNVYGAELSATFMISDYFELSTNVAFVDKNEFTTSGDNPQVVPLNAPTAKGNATLLYRNEDAGLNANLRFRAQNGFPANSGVYIGDVGSFEVFDLGAGWRLPNMRDVWLQIDVMNLFDKQYASFIGTPNLGRMMLARVRWDFTPF